MDLRSRKVNHSLKVITGWRKYNDNIVMRPFLKNLMRLNSFNVALKKGRKESYMFKCKRFFCKLT